MVYITNLGICLAALTTWLLYDRIRFLPLDWDVTENGWFRFGFFYFILSGLITKTPGNYFYHCKYSAISPNEQNKTFDIVVTFCNFLQNEWVNLKYILRTKMSKKWRREWYQWIWIWRNYALDVFISIFSIYLES